MLQWHNNDSQNIILKWHSAQEIQNKLSAICWGTSESNKSLEYTVQNTFLGQIQSYTKC